ncbi:MAG TPA: DUF1080 domain-containing protein, partial [Terracidiphilus sp.]
MKFLSAVLVAGLVAVPKISIAAGAAGGDAQPFLGRWDLTLKAPDAEYPSWLEVQEQGGEIKARFTGRWGNARPLPKIEVTGGSITFVSPKEEESSKSDLVFQGQLNGGRLSGTVNVDGKTWQWTGVKAPALVPKGTPNWGKPIQLFNGKDLSGWHESKAGPPDWTVKDGNLVSPGNGPELINDQKFQDFKLHVEFSCGKDANSGV